MLAIDFLTYQTSDGYRWEPIYKSQVYLTQCALIGKCQWTFQNPCITLQKKNKKTNKENKKTQ